MLNNQKIPSDLCSPCRQTPEYFLKFRFFRLTNPQLGAILPEQPNIYTKTYPITNKSTGPCQLIKAKHICTIIAKFGIFLQ